MKESTTTVQLFEAVATEESFVLTFGAIGSHYWSIFVKNEFILPGSLLSCNCSIARIENYMRDAGHSVQQSIV